MISKLVLAEHKVAAALISAVVVAGLGLGIWTANSILPYPADAIPAPHIGHFTMCSIPMWLQTQDRSVRWLGDCMGQLYSPPPEMRLGRGTVLAIGCRPGGCPLGVFLYSTSPKSWRPRGSTTTPITSKRWGLVRLRSGLPLGPTSTAHRHQTVPSPMVVPRSSCSYRQVPDGLCPEPDILETINPRADPVNPFEGDGCGNHGAASSPRGGLIPTAAGRAGGGPSLGGPVTRWTGPRERRRS